LTERSVDGHSITRYRLSSTTRLPLDLKRSPVNQQDIVDQIAGLCVESALSWPWLHGEMTVGMAQAFVIQHSIRNRLFSACYRPAWMSRCPDQALVRKTIGQMLEELVYDENLKAAHTKILFDLARNVGLADKQLHEAKPNTKTDIWHQVTENLCRTRHWIIGWLSTSLEEFVLMSLNRETNSGADKWQKDLGLTDEQLFFFRYHEKADLEHAGKAVWMPIRRYVTTPELAADVMAGLDTALEAARIFYEGVMDQARELDAQGVSLPSAA
jgi:pyrroloquinoline quinone (PQQ) biosynthesis protein C